MAFTLASNYDPRAQICYVTFDGVLVNDFEVDHLFALFAQHLHRVPQPHYVIANCDAWRVDTPLMRAYGHALGAFCTAHGVCLACYSADIYARMNLRLAGVISGASVPLFATPTEALQFVRQQQPAPLTIHLPIPPSRYI